MSDSKKQMGSGLPLEGESFVQVPSERYLKYKKLHHCPKHGGEAKPEDCELCEAARKSIANLSYSDLDPNAMPDSVDGDY